MKTMQPKKIRFQGWEKELDESEVSLFTLARDGVPPIKWLVKPIMPSKSITYFVGEGGSFKSWAGIELAYCAVSKNKFLDCFEIGEFEGNVLYIDEENGDYPMARRFIQLVKGKSNFEEYKKNIEYLKKIKLYTYTGIGIDDEDPKEIIYLVKKHNIGLIIFDSVVRLMDGDENSAQDVRRIHKGLKKFLKPNFLKELGVEHDVCMVFIHHTSKGGKTARGSGDFKNMSDYELFFTETKKEAHAFEINLTKHRQSRGMPTHAVHVLDSEDKEDFISFHAEVKNDEEAVSEPEKVEDKAKERMLEFLYLCIDSDNFDGKISTSEKDDWYKYVTQEVKGEERISRTAWFNALTLLKLDEIIYDGKRGVYSVNSQKLNTLRGDTFANFE